MTSHSLKYFFCDCNHRRYRLTTIMRPISGTLPWQLRLRCYRIRQYASLSQIYSTTEKLGEIKQYSAMQTYRHSFLSSHLQQRLLNSGTVLFLLQIITDIDNICQELKIIIRSLTSSSSTPYLYFKSPIAPFALLQNGQ
jgi:hypothetical protein